MIIGSGLIAKAFESYCDNQAVLIFAKGVSNSQETDQAEFGREQGVLEEAIESNRDKIFVYFGTCSVADEELKSTPYVKHKLHMEKIIQDSGLKYHIFRLPQAVGFTKSPTLINYLASKIRNGDKFDIWRKSARDLIDIDDVYKICSFIIDNNYLENHVVNVATNIKAGILEIVLKLERLLNKKGNYTIKDKGASYSIDTQLIDMYLDQINVDFSGDYINRILKKYVR